ncbi:Tn3 family transposase, partial [Escherichia coli]
GFHGIVIPGTLRDSIFVLEGLLEQETGLNPTEIMTDTAGASEPRQPGGCKLKTAPVRPVVAARPAEYVCSEDLFY